MREHTALESGSGVEKLRVVFQLRLREGAEERFVAAYEGIRYEVARVPGYLGDELCQSAEDPLEWLVTSEWESLAHFLEWESGAAHRELAAPLVACAVSRKSSRYLVRFVTSGSGRLPGRPVGEGLSWTAMR